MFYSQYLFAIGVLSYLDLDDFYHPFAFASQQILLYLIEIQVLAMCSASTSCRRG